MIKTLKTKYDIIVGLKDKNTNSQKYKTEVFIKIIAGICKNKKIEFYINPIFGGYIKEDGRYTLERSIIISIINSKESDVILISKKIKELFNQEEIIITKSILEEYLI